MSGGRLINLGQVETVERLLTQAGERGVHSFELRAGMAFDLGEFTPIANPGERIARLKKRGVQIVGRSETLNGTSVGKRWWLTKHAPADVLATTEQADARG